MFTLKIWLKQVQLGSDNLHSGGFGFGFGLTWAGVLDNVLDGLHML